MSNAVFPTLPGIAWNVTKTPQWSTSVQQTASGKELRASFYTSPIWKWVLNYDVLRADAAFNELQQLIGFFNARAGKFDSFLFSDPDDNTVLDESFGVGDGTTTAFQLKRALGGFAESIFNLNGTPTIKKAGVVQSSGFTIGATGIVTFTSAPASATALTWSGSYYWRARFDQDTTEFNKFNYLLWNLQQLILVSVK